MRLNFYGARYFDSSLGRFISADTVVPGAGNPQAWDRFAYTFNSPVNYTDPTGHYGEDVHNTLTWCAVFSSVYSIGGSYGYSTDELRMMAIGIADAVTAGDMACDMKNTDGSLNWDFFDYNPALYPDMFGGIDTPHYKTTREAEILLGNASSPFDFGVALHTYQDSYSHWQKLEEPDSSSGVWWAHLRNDIERLFGEEFVDDLDLINDPIDAAMWENMQEQIDEYIINLFENGYEDCWQ